MLSTELKKMQFVLFNEQLVYINKPGEVKKVMVYSMEHKLILGIWRENISALLFFHNILGCLVSSHSE